MSFHIVVESKAWNRAELLECRINTYWENEIDFDIVEYQVRNENDENVFRSENEDAVVQFMENNDERDTIFNV